jgi:2-(1,2-epoxy-1,2-dihydrophenyl)acetyl-CoA isomerase
METIELERRGAAATIRLNRPQALNAWDRQLGVDLLAAVSECAGDPDVRAVCLTGAGRAFSSGADLRAGFEGSRGDGVADVHTALVERYHPIMEAIRAMPKPVVAAVNGPAVGIGCSLPLCCDLVVAAESAYFLLAFVNIGFVPDGGSSAWIPARVGFTRAMEMAMLGERVPARQALDWGLVNRVWPDETFQEEAAALVDRLAAGPTRSYAGTKRQLNRWVFGGLEDQLRLESDIQQEMAGTADFVEGVTSFVEKRGANFRGQ